MGPTGYAPSSNESWKSRKDSGRPVTVSGPAEKAAPEDDRGSDDPASSLDANSARTLHPSDDPVTLRAHNRALAEVIVEQQDILRRVRALVEEYRSRAGAQIDAGTVAASFWPIIEGHGR
jgi:hypothetical protein